METFSIKIAIKKTLNLLDVQFRNKDIKIIQELEEIKLKNYENQLIQVIINLLNNAKDEFERGNINHEKLILIKCYKEDSKVIIQIQDNAGGIPQEIITRVFEPYFTTKHQSQGTGIGLFMSNEIITKNMNGNIEVKNSEFDYKGKKYIGALFEIRLF